MANALIIYEGSGPLPVTATFKAPSDGDVVFVLSGTARTDSAALLTGIILVSTACKSAVRRCAGLIRTTIIRRCVRLLFRSRI